MITDAITRLVTSRLSKILIALAVLVVVASQAVPYVVDTKPYLDRITASVGEATGATLMVKGGADLQLVPYPALILHSLELTQPNVPRSPSITAEAAELKLGIMSLFSGDPHVQHIRIGGVAITAEKQPSGAEAGFAGFDILKKLAAVKPSGSVSFEVIGGRITVADVASGESTGISGLNASGIFAETSEISGTMQYNSATLRFSASRKGVIGATPITLSIDNASGSTLKLDGSMDLTSGSPVITAKLDVNASDITQFAVAQQQKDPKDLKPTDAHIALPLKLTADYLQSGDSTQLTGMNFEMLDSKATGSLDWKGGAAGNHKLMLEFSTLDAARAREVVALFMHPPARDVNDLTPSTLFPKHIDLMLDVRAAQLINGAQSWSKATFNGTIADGVLTVNQLTLNLPGESRLALFGLLSVSDTQGLRFEGNTEAQGESLREMLTVFDESAGDLPATGFGAFRVRSNLFISREQLRLSEADAKFSDLSLKGGLVAYFDKKPRIEAEVGLRDIDFDYFRNNWRTNARENDTGAKIFLRFDKDVNFDWLKKLSASIDFKVDVQGFNFLERKGRSASFRLFAQSGEIGVYNAKFNYDTDITEANLKLDVNGATPAISLVLNTSELNTNYFMSEPDEAAPVVPVAVEAPAALAEPLPEMTMPAADPQEELRQKIAEEAAALAAAAPATPMISDPERPAEPVAATAAAPAEPEAIVVADELPEPEASAPVEEIAEEPSEPVELKPLVRQDGESRIEIEPRSLLIREALAQEALRPASPELMDPVPSTTSGPNGEGRWTEDPIDMSLIEGINGNFDISVGRLQHKHLLFQNVKMLAKLERNLLSFQTLTFMHWGGSLSINGSIFGGKVPGISLGFILASVDIQQMLDSLLGVRSVGGRASISGTLDTSGVNLLSWVSQASAKMLFAGRGVSIRGLDVASVLGAVGASRTAADVFNSVNYSLVGGSGEYSVDGAVNLQRGVLSSPGTALRTGRIVGNVTGDFRLLPWDINMNGNFKFPELSAENVPTLTVRWTGPVANPSMQTDTQALEAFVSKRIIGN